MVKKDSSVDKFEIVAIVKKVFREEVEKLGMPRDYIVKTIDYIWRRADKIPDVISRIEDLIEIGRGNLSAVIKSTEAERKRAVSIARYIDLLSGEEKIAWSGKLEPEAYLWKTVVGVSGAKCSCPDALWNVVHAYKGLRIINKRLAVEAEIKLVFDRYQLCKHVLALLGILLYRYGVEPYQKHVRVLSVNALLAVIGESGKRPPRDAYRAVYGVVRKIIDEL